MPDYSLPPWLTRQYDFGASLARGVQSGSEIHHNFLADAQNQREEALMPLRQQQMQNQIQETALDIHTKQELDADRLANKGAFSKLATEAANISEAGAWANPASEKRIWQIAAENPSVVGTPQFQNIVKQFDVAGAAAIKAQQADTRLQQIQGEYEIGKERNLLSQQKLSDTQAALAEKIASNERIAAAKNATELEKAHVQAENRALKQGFDLLNHSLQARYVQQVKSIFDKDNPDFADKSPAARERAALEAHKRLMEESRAGMQPTTPVAQAIAPSQTDDPWIPMLGPDGKTRGRVKRS